MKRPPPKIAHWALRITNRKKNRDTILGDFEEFFNEIYVESGASKANFWYWKQTLKSVPQFIKTTINWRFVMFKNYFKIVIRNILKHKAFSLINITGLAISLSLCLFVIQLIFSIYSSDGFQKNKARIYRVISSFYGKNRAIDFATAPLPLAGELKNNTEIETVLRLKKNFGGYSLYKDKKILVQGYYSDKEFFIVFSFPLEIGDPSAALAEPYSVVLTKKIARKYFGDKNPLGESLYFKDLGIFKITGVMKDISNLKSHMRFECLASFSTLASLERKKKILPCLKKWENLRDNYIYLLLRKKTPSLAIERSFSKIIKKHYHNPARTYIFHLQALTKISPGKNLGNFLSVTVKSATPYILSCIAFIIILIACFNYTNLSLAKSLSRAKEVGIRKVVGASRLKLVTQFIGEAVIISLIALVIAFILLEFLESFFYSFNSELRLLKGMNGRSIGVYTAFILFAIFTGVFAGFFPAIYLSKYNPSIVLKDITGVRLFSRFTLRKTLIVIQFFISFVFIITTTVFYKQINFLTNLDLGFNIKNMLNVDLQKVKYETFRQEVSNYHLFSGVSASSFVLCTGNRWITYAKHSKTFEVMEIDELSVDENFIKNIGLKLIAGQVFPENSRFKNERFVILNEKTVKQFGFGTPLDAIGQRLEYSNGEGLEILGVVKDFFSSQVTDPIRPLILKVEPQIYKFANIRIHGNNREEIVRYLEGKWKKLDPNGSLQYKFFEDELDEYNSEGFNVLRAIGFITFLSILVSFFGLLGMVIYDTEAKEKEIGIRKIMGASVFDIIMVISKDFVYLLVLAAILSIPLAWFLSTMVLQSMAHRIVLGFDIFVFGVLIVFTTGFIIIFSQTIKAAYKNPVDSLRYE